MNFSDIRRDFGNENQREPQWPEEPFALFSEWLEKAVQSNIPEANASTRAGKWEQSRFLGVELPGKTRGDMMLDYLDVWTGAGVPPAEILKAMTTNCAQLMRIDKERGAIAPGLAGDIIATGKDPLQDIHALRAVSFVMKNEQVVKYMR